jgi:hypothetical protein
MASDQEHEAVRMQLASRITDEILQTMRESTQPHLVYTAIPMVLAGLAGSYVLNHMRVGLIGDGTTDKVLALLCELMRENAQPSDAPDDPALSAFRDDFRKFMGMGR